MSEPQNWERQAIEKLAFSALQEQRRGRHWSIFFKTLGFVYLFALLFIGLDWIGPTKSIGSHTALIDIQGEIGAEGQVTADNTISSLQAAFDDKNTKGIILRINSPGGSPVQAGIINDEIRRQRKLHPTVPVYAVVEDMCASGGYYIAVAADKIFVDKASIVGSIGVIMDGFGFTGTMQKLGVERRVMTAGENKDLLDPFSPLNPAHKAFAQSLLNEIHQQFIAVVREGRGKRLKETPEIFSGLFWSGQRSIELGLADGLGSSDSVARDVIKEENIVDFTTHEGLADRFAKRFGATMANTLSGAAVRLH
ncbi:putative signal peptide peptidase SppA [mine drainage metagenome]|uniref:Putative signal peptide peptidase SppA n=1 Tax=mine drainage metagenome TaxID=410659 RepID=A0A1J5QB92_9ZZZZ